MLDVSFFYWRGLLPTGANDPRNAQMSQDVSGWMEVGSFHQGFRQSDCCKSIFCLALTGEERGCSYLQQQLSEQALSNAAPWGNWVLETFVKPCMVRSSQCALCIYRGSPDDWPFWPSLLKD